MLTKKWDTSRDRLLRVQFTSGHENKRKKVPRLNTSSNTMPPIKSRNSPI
jgi:hypothetical protein